jgi:hypothetical protein
MRELKSREFGELITQKNLLILFPNPCCPRCLRKGEAFRAGWQEE